MEDGYITQSTVDSIVEKLDNRIAELESKVWDAHLREKSLKYQIEQRDKTIKKAHALLTLEAKRV